MTTDKLSIQALVQICYKQGIRRVVFSPGSRNAPLVIAFSEHKGFETIVIPDERVAAFHALGQGIATGKPSVICCTSGTAALNYGPAIAEAYYQQVPLLVLTADRPVEWIDMGIGQSMRQEAVFANYVKGSYQFTQEASHPDDLWYNERLANKAITETTSGAPGPVHINLPFRESLYTQAELQPLRHPTLKVSRNDYVLSEEDVTELKSVWSHTTKRLIIIGQRQPDLEESTILNSLIKKGGVVVMTETTSNVRADKLIDCIDRVLPLVGEDEKYHPDLVISFGGAIVSKRIKTFLKKAKPTYHIELGLSNAKDTYQRLSHHYKIQPLPVLEELLRFETINTKYAQNWHQVNAKARALHNAFLLETSYCDLKVFEVLLKEIPESAILHFASSTPIRYSQLFSEYQAGRLVQCNRGVSGIDGSTSTALGYAGCSDHLNILITGDISFFYDSNAFWLRQRPSNLKVILINNGGGNIFKYIPGPETTAQLSVFEADHQLSARPVAQLYGLSYSRVSTLEDLEAAMPRFYSKDLDKISILEINTKSCSNAETLRNYFDYLVSNSSV